jgi:hypothetical protein
VTDAAISGDDNMIHRIKNIRALPKSLEITRIIICNPAKKADNTILPKLASLLKNAARKNTNRIFTNSEG